MDNKRRKKIQDAIITGCLLALFAHAYRVDGTVRELQVKEPLTKEDIRDLKNEVRNLAKTMQDFMIDYASKNNR